MDEAIPIECRRCCQPLTDPARELDINANKGELCLDCQAAVARLPLEVA
jgi:hypothetical protein